MSWSFTVDKAAHKDEAKAKVAERRSQHFPAEAEAVIAAAIDALPDCERSTVSVSTYGHFHQGAGRATSNISVVVSNSFAD